MPRENGPEDSSQLGEETYQRLEQSGVFAGHDGETVLIHPATGTYVIGEGIPAVTELLKEVRRRPGQSMQSDDDITSKFYSGPIGKAGRAPFGREIPEGDRDIEATQAHIKGERIRSLMCDLEATQAELEEVKELLLTGGDVRVSDAIMLDSLFVEISHTVDAIRSCQRK